MASSSEDVRDMTLISDIDEEGINNNLHKRYSKDKIYTYAGTILVAVNPYKELGIYTTDHVFQYHGSKMGALEPHVFALAEAAYSSMQTMDENQSCVISGESGAGKTETTKFILQYLCSVTSDVSTWVEQQILEANTILESFGNAKTVRNDNSSRFGKFMQVCFNDKRLIRGCIIQDYLLEQSRITFQSPGERNYHVFYQLVEGAKGNKDLVQQFRLKPAEFYKYLNQSGCISIEGVNDARKFDSLRLAFSILRIPLNTCDGIFCVLSAILWLGNTVFQDVDGEKCQLADSDADVLSNVAFLLGLQLDDVIQVTLRRQINVRGNITEIPLKLQEARENRHAMAKALYSRTFAWLVNHINICTNPGQDSSRFLGVLDIFGFENFAVNSFEQLCINYTNEKLHKFFNHYVFALEQDIYRQEEIQFSHIQFTDNTACLELIEKPPRCILKLLTEQCHMPKGCDTSYIANLHTEFDSHDHYLKGDDRRKWELEFGINHYAGVVTYTVCGFVDKNRDVQQDVFFDFMSRSTNAFVQELTKYQDLLGATANRMGNVVNNGITTISRGTTKGKPTVSDTFRHQLQALVDVLQSTNPWYVRCIKPNMMKMANDYDEKLVLDQLKYLGMLEIIRIRKEGYPIHLPFIDFVDRYRCTTKKTLPKECRDAAKMIMNLTAIDSKEWQLGKTKIFLRNKAHEPMEDLRKKLLNGKSLIIQRNWKRHLSRKEYLRMRNAAIRIQNAYRSWKQRIDFLRKRRAVIIIQSHLRGLFAREVAAALRHMRRVEEDMRKKEKTDVKQKIDDDNEEKQNEAEMEEINDIYEHEIDSNCEQMDIVTIAEQLNYHLHEKAHDSVDLENLFAFLSDAKNHSGDIIEQLGEKMEELVSNLDMELENVLQQELEHLQPDEETTNNNINKISPPNVLDLSQQQQQQQQPTRKQLKVPSLPEPTCPPPPPPQFQEMMNGHAEPIYESVLPRDETDIVPESPPPLPAPTCAAKVRPISPMLERVQKSEKSSPITAVLSPKQSRPSSRASSTGGGQNTHQWRYSEQLEDFEKEQRRKYRVEKKLQELEEIQEKKNDTPQEVVYQDIVEFAQKYFNPHEKLPDSGNIIATLTRKRKSLDSIPKYEMVTYYKGSTIPTSHIHMHDPDNVVVACNIFKELCKYSRGELKPDTENNVIQMIIEFGIEREELRDEIYVQCMRQATNNPCGESTEKLWLILCLIVVSFQPSKLLHKYFTSFLKKNLQCEGKLLQYVQWCLDNCKNTKASSRKYPPSTVEIAAMKRLGTIVCRFFFLDGRTKAIDIHPMDTASDAAAKLADKLGLQSLDGWAIYQSLADNEEHVRGHHYLYDIISAWEMKQNKQPQHSSFSLLNRRSNSNAVGGGENRFVFKRRLFRNLREMSQDPVEISLLYAQAVHSVVKCDDFPINEKVAIQLAGLQAQVSVGEPKEKLEHYTDIESYLPYRISKCRGDDVWVTIIAQAHKQYGSGKSEIIAKILYLSCVMQYKLYGTTIFPVTYRGYWSYGNSLLLGINCDGLILLKAEDKLVLYEFHYYDIESIFLDPSDSFLTINLMRHHNDNGGQKCFVFETSQKSEIGSLIVSYCPALATWITESEPIAKAITAEDRTRSYRTLVECRRCLAECGILNKPQEGAGKFIKNTLRRFSKQRLEKLWNENGFSEYSETYKGYSLTYWAFSRQPLIQSICKLSEADELVAVNIYHTLLMYAGLYQNGENVCRSEEEHISLIQSIVEKAMRKECLLDELFMQLIKQTTEHPDPNSRVNLRHWAVLSLVCSIALPSNKNVRKYLFAHLKKCASDCITEEGKYARFAEKCASKTQGTKRRQWPPSKEEIMCTINRRMIYTRFHFMDGQYHAIEFHPSATASDVVAIIKNKIGLRESALGYAIYEVFGNSERSLDPEEKVADAMSKWEHYRNANATSTNTSSTTNTIKSSTTRRQTHLFLFKKHLFLDQYLDLNDPVEKELLYHQILHSLRTDRFPVTENEASMLVALQAQVELSDYFDTIEDYRSVASHCLPTRLSNNIDAATVAMHHQSLTGMTSEEAKKSFLNLIRSWPLHRAIIFDVMQSFTSNWPRVLWLAVDQIGLHLLEHRSRNVLCSYEYDSVLNYSPAPNCLMIITGNEKKQSKVIISTSQALQIANLIREYTEVLQKAPATANDVRRRETKKTGQNSNRPVSILHKPIPAIDQTPPLSPTST